MFARYLILGFMAVLALDGSAADKSVNITQTLAGVDVLHQGAKVRIERNPDHDNMLDPDYSLTSRPCPPFCVQPMSLGPGVETIGELELLEYLKKSGKDAGVLVIDSRDGDWPRRSGVIPGAVVIPWQELHPAHTDPEKIADALIFRFGATRQGGLWNFENAKTLVLYCNGPWCGQSPTNIKQLLALGYPAHKLKWYRGGMQDWKMLGLTTVMPK
ncbi:MAG TPA: rhodanese-like domain-containing protein [Thiobacillaceae bacterium]|nr:rhodanese-like domain-containing protein [Thiobacillaceae bacterium]HNF89446.1 rhodanese-like domain-containing protein [Thiobacillaceae bacterium]HNH89981.1 rhodanese-like domain-containing protein [Thiobacillaceae bacterium]HNI08095.1 rhodanese-like domain-containing protein [Thiobacillaceae bacterium]